MHCYNGMSQNICLSPLGLLLSLKRISGFCFLLFSGKGMGSLGRRRNFLVVTGLISMESDNRNPAKEESKSYTIRSWHQTWVSITRQAAIEQCRV